MIARVFEVAARVHLVFWSRPMEALITYIFTAILSWCPLATYFVPYGETPAAAQARMHQIAEDIVTVAMDASEPPVFAGPTGRIKTALLNAAIPSKETSFQTFVEEGKCNERGYHADLRGNCDGGTAWSFWQIHIFGGGYILLDDGTLSSRDAMPRIASARPDVVINGPRLIADRQIAARLAQRLERSTMKSYGSLCAFSGEPCNGRHPKADARLERAMDYWAKHPFTDAVPEPVSVGAKYLASINNAAPNAE